MCNPIMHVYHHHNKKEVVCQAFFKRKNSNFGQPIQEMLHDRPLSAEPLQSFAAVKQFLEIDGIAYKKTDLHL